MTDISTKQAWLMATRPKTLPAALAPVLVGTAQAWADNGFHFLAAVAAMAGSILLQIGVNLANDYFDFVKGIDTKERVGPVRVTQSGLIRPEIVRLVMILVFALAALIGIYLIFRGGVPILIIGLASILAALGYSGGPFPFASRGLGDLFVFIFFGLVAVCGTYYVQTLQMTWPAFAHAIPIGFLITAILVVNNLRDIETDEKSGKRTLSVIIGPEKSRQEYLLLILFSYILPVLLCLKGYASPWVFLVFLSFPMAVSRIANIYRSSGGQLNDALAATAKLTIVFSILLSIALVIQ